MGKQLFFRLQIILLILLGCGNPQSGEETQSTQKEAPDEQYTMQGKILAQTAGAHLMNKLTTKISDRGVTEAIRYCNLVANPILDSLSTLYHANIGRRSDRLRNKANAGDSLDQSIIREYRTLIAEGLQPSVKTVSSKEDEVRFYAPIFTKALCLNCHGVPSNDISPQNLSTIQELYPSDKAINFKIGELRGIWSITFRK